MLARQSRSAARTAIATLGLFSAGTGVTSAAADDLTVLAAYDPVLRASPEWVADFRCALRRAGELLRPVLGRDLRLVDRVPWMGARGSGTLRELRRNLIDRVEPSGADLVIGLVVEGGDRVATFDDEPQVGTGAGRSEPSTESGLAAYSQGYVVLRLGTPLCRSSRLVAHEIAHVFGGIHRPEPDLLMSQGRFGDALDELNRALLDLHADRDIRGGEPPLRGDALRSMWRLASASADEAATWARVGALAALMGKPHDALPHYERALEIDDADDAAWAGLGNAYLMLERFAEAETAYLEAMRLRPDDGRLHNNLAVTCMSTGRAGVAAMHAARALDLGFPMDEAFVRAIEEVTGKPLRRPGQ